MQDQRLVADVTSSAICEKLDAKTTVRSGPERSADGLRYIGDTFPAQSGGTSSA